MNSGTRASLAVLSLLVLLVLPWALDHVVKPGKAPHVPSYLDKFERPVILCHRGSRYVFALSRFKSIISDWFEYELTIL